jgi:hypothetical protein
MYFFFFKVCVCFFFDRNQKKLKPERKKGTKKVLFPWEKKKIRTFFFPKNIKREPLISPFQFPSLFFAEKKRKRGKEFYFFSFFFFFD